MQTASPFLHVEDFDEALKTSKCKILDASYALPNAKTSTYDNFQAERLPDTLFFDIDKVSDKKSDFPHMLPDAPTFEDRVSKLGISNNDTILIYGQKNFLMGPARAWWMFKSFGHNNVYVLNGNIESWKKSGRTTETKPPSIPSKNCFSATKNESYICDFETILNASRSKDVTILDARPAGRFNGSTPEPRADIESGHIPGSLNLPCSSFINPQTQTLKPDDNLRNILNSAGYLENHKTITTCGSGITACAIFLVLYHLGYRNACVYDGSWSEWYPRFQGITNG